MASTPTSLTCNFEWILIPSERETMAALRTQTLSENWQWKQRPDGTKSSVDALGAEDGWRPTTVPTEIFKDLLEAGEIQDPHVDLHEKEVQWVGEVDWLYRTRFTVDHAPESGEKAVLAFDGLDTFASVYFNGKHILQTEALIF
jgi:beta-mannosidase